MSNLLSIPKGTTRYIGVLNTHYGNQFSVKNKKEMIDIIDEYLGLANISISMCYFKDSTPYLLYLPLDFDSVNLEDSWRDAVKLYNHLLKCGYDIQMTFSGRRGFHIFLGVKPKNYSRQRIRAIQKYFKEKLNLTTLDKNIFGDIRRLMRIPHTWNINGGRLCRILYKEEGELVDLDDIILPEVIKEYKTTYKTREFHKYPCVERLIKDKDYWHKHHPDGKYEPAQKIRFTWCVLRLAEGKTEEEIVEEAKSFGWDDWDADYTRRQIEQIDLNEYVPPSCKTLQSLDYCGEYCKYNTNIDTMLKSINIKSKK